MPETDAIRILYMEDDPGLARLVQRRLAQGGYDVDVAEDGGAGVARVGAVASPYDLLIVDQNMPVYSGLRVLQILAERGDFPATIMLTGSGSEETAVEAMKLGASDYVVKDVSGAFLDLLPAAIDRVLEKRRLVEERRRAEEALVESEARFRAVAQTAVDAIVTVDSAGCITFWNSGAASMFGYTGAAITACAFSQLIAPASRPEDREGAFSFTGRPCSVRRVESMGLRADGSTFPIEVSLTSWQTRTDVCYTAIIRDITERKAYQDRLEHMAHHDALTGAYNRHYLAEILDRETARARRYRHPIGFLMIDADRFKQINDERGHEAGDTVLKILVEVIVGCVREVDIVVRYGGDEFLIILPETDGKISVTKERILAAVAGRRDLTALAGFPVTLSIGCAHWSPDDPQPIDKILDRADKNMYAAKQDQRDV